MALSLPVAAAPMFLCMSTTSRPPAWTRGRPTARIWYRHCGRGPLKGH